MRRAASLLSPLLLSRYRDGLIGTSGLNDRGKSSHHGLRAVPPAVAVSGTNVNERHAACVIALVRTKRLTCLLQSTRRHLSLVSVSSWAATFRTHHEVT